MSLIAILGKTPNLSIAELESLYGDQAILDKNEYFLELGIASKNFDINRVGGTQKVAVFIDSFDVGNWRRIQDYLSKNVINICNPQSGSKVKLGISTYGFDVSPAVINATGLGLKKALKSAGFSCRIIPSKAHELNSAQVIHGGLLKASNAEILVIKSGSRVIIAKTLKVQDIDAYAARDQARPHRDSFVGMLPPKLAQTLVNLTATTETKTILDPFCGTGVVLQEAALSGYSIAGSDLEPRMVDFTQKNLDWLKNTFDVHFESSPSMSVADATSHQWFSDSKIDPRSTAIACETFLGHPLSRVPSAEVLNKIVQDCNTIHKKFLRNIARQTKAEFRMCLAIPAWKVNNKTIHLPLLDSLSDLGYNYISFSHVDSKSLVYQRADQIVAREILVLTRN